MGPDLWELFEDGGADDEIAAIIRLGRSGILPKGVRLVSQFGEIITVRMTRADVLKVNGAPEVVNMAAGDAYVGPDVEANGSDSSELSTDSLPTDERRPKEVAATGKGVVIGIVDWGFDFFHSDFRNPDGTTRILALWDQRGSRRPGSPQPFGYGIVHDKEAINRALKSPDPYAALGYHPADADPGFGCHGTHVASIAAGSGGEERPTGVAPAADLVLVHNAPWDEAEPSRLGDSVTLLEGVDFIARAATGRPWVINLSMGRHSGYHNGLELVEQGFDAALRSEPGRAISLSAGNYFDKHIHASGQLRPTEERALTWEIKEGKPTNNTLEFWYSWQDKMEVAVRSPGGSLQALVKIGERAKLVVGGKEVGNVYHRGQESISLNNHISIYLYADAPSGAWEITLIGTDVIDGRYHAWIERDVSCPRCQSRFSADDADPRSTTGTICNGRRTFAVGAYNNHDPERRLGRFSSSGPTLDGRLKPDLCAPGVSVLAARSATRDKENPSPPLTRMSGTSMASPHVTGTIALMFEAAPRRLRIEETHNLLLKTAQRVSIADELTDRIGIGFLDAAKAVEAARKIGIESDSFKQTTVQAAGSPFPPASTQIKDSREAVTTLSVATQEGAEVQAAVPHSCSCQHSQASLADSTSDDKWLREALDAAAAEDTPKTTFDPAAPSKEIASALDAKNWSLALSLAIREGLRDENDLTNLIFFAKHPELPREKLDAKNAKFKQLSAEWARTRDGDVWKAIQTASENPTLVVRGSEVADHDRFFWGTNGRKLKRLVENAAKEVDLNTGLLGAILMAETRSPLSYLSSEKVSSYFIGVDDFYEARAALAAKVPAYKKVKWDKNQTPRVHLNDAIKPREVKTIDFDSGPDGLLATAVYVKLREVRLREIAAELDGDFEALPVEVRFALTRMAMAGGTEGAKPFLKNALAGKDILIRKNIPVRIHELPRNATVRTAQAMHLSEWVFGVTTGGPVETAEVDSTEQGETFAAEYNEAESESWPGETIVLEAGADESESRLSPAQEKQRQRDINIAHRNPHPGTRPGSSERLLEGQVDVIETTDERRSLLLWNFDVDGSYLKPEHEAALRESAEWLAPRVPEWRRRAGGKQPCQVFVAGFASHTGNRSHNETLARDREENTLATLGSLLAADIRSDCDRAGKFDAFWSEPDVGENSKQRAVRIVIQAQNLAPPQPIHIDQCSNLKIWINAFIPRDVTGYTFTVTGGVHKGKTAIPCPTAAATLANPNCFRLGYLTDQRGFDASPTASVRMRSIAEIALLPPNFVRHAGLEHVTSGTTEIEKTSGAVTCVKDADMRKCHFSNFRSAPDPAAPFSGNFFVRLNVKSGASDPCVNLAADIDYEGEITVFCSPRGGVVEVSFRGTIDSFPAFEMYASLNGVTKPLFRIPPPPGNTVVSLLGGSSTPVSGRVKFAPCRFAISTPPRELVTEIEEVAQEIGSAELVELVDRFVLEKSGVRTSISVVQEMTSRSAAADLFSNATPGNIPSPAQIFDALSSSRRTELRRQLERQFEVVGLPNSLLEREVREADLIVRRGDGDAAHVAVVAGPGLKNLAALEAEGLTAESSRAGNYAQVIEGGLRSHARSDFFARQLTDSVGRLLNDVLLLRLAMPPTVVQVQQPAAKSNDDPGDETEVPEACVHELSDFGRSWRASHDQTRNPRTQKQNGTPLCDGQADLVLHDPDKSTLDLLLFNFDIDGSYPKVQHETALDDLVARMRRRLTGDGQSERPSGYQISLQGYADRTGSARYNELLANDREAAVETYLRSKMENLPEGTKRLLSVEFTKMQGGFAPDALPGKNTPHARAVLVWAVPIGGKKPKPRPIPPIPPIPPGQNRLDPNFWFLPSDEMGERAPAFTEGNEVRALIDGEKYMADLLASLNACDRRLYFAGWRFTAEQNLNPINPSPTPLYTAIQGAILRGVRIRALIYKVFAVNFPAMFRIWHFEDNRFFCEALRTDGQEPVLDGRFSPKPMSAHHQKFVLCESSNAERTSAYVGGIDLCLDRWDSSSHSSTCPHPVPSEPRQCDAIEFYRPFLPLHPGLTPLLALKSSFNKYFPSQPGWHDVQAKVRGPAIQQIWQVFKNRWNDPRPGNTDRVLTNCQKANPINDPAPALPPFSPGTAWVQVTQTLPCKGIFGPYPFAPKGEQTVEKAYRRAIERAENYIYIEDQYLWPSTLVDPLVAALKRGVIVVVVVARDYDLPLISAIHVRMRAEVVNRLRAANPSRFKIFHLQQPGGGQIYVHAKTMIIDDMVAFIGSANLNHRSMTNDTELHLGILDSIAVNVPIDGKIVQVSKFAHEYRCELWQEHLGASRAQVLDLIFAINTLWATAPGPNRRVIPHQVPPPDVDPAVLAELIVNLVIDLGIPPIPGLPLLDPALPKKMLQAPVEAALRASGSLVKKVLDWLADILNPRLSC